MVTICKKLISMVLLVYASKAGNIVYPQVLDVDQSSANGPECSQANAQCRTQTNAKSTSTQRNRDNRNDNINENVNNDDWRSVKNTRRPANSDEEIGMLPQVDSEELREYEAWYNRTIVPGTRTPNNKTDCVGCPRLDGTNRRRKRRQSRDDNDDDVGVLPVPSAAELAAMGFSEESNQVALSDDVEMQPRGNALPCSAEASGKLKYINSGDGGNYYCTAAYYGPTKRILITAAHCVYGREGWHTDHRFIQGYENSVGNEKEISRLYKKAGWKGQYPKDGTMTPWHLDYAFILMAEESDGCTLGRYLPVAPENLKTAVWTQGYPGNYHNGKQFAVTSNQHYFAGNGVMKIVGNPMTGGCSGGAWESEVWQGEAKADGGEYVVSVNSYGDPSKGLIGGPILDDDALELYKEVLADLEAMDADNTATLDDSAERR